MTIFTIGNLLSAAAPGYATPSPARRTEPLNHGAFFGLGVIVAASVVPREKYASAVATMFMGLTIAIFVACRSDLGGRADRLAHGVLVVDVRARSGCYYRAAAGAAEGRVWQGP